MSKLTQIRVKVELEFCYNLKFGDAHKAAQALLDIVGDRILSERRSGGTRTLYSNGLPIGRYSIETLPAEAS